MDDSDVLHRFVLAETIHPCVTSVEIVGVHAGATSTVTHLVFPLCIKGMHEDKILPPSIAHCAGGRLADLTKGSMYNDL